MPLDYCRCTPGDEFWRARALMKVGQHAQAAKWFEPGIRRHTDSPMCSDARYELGECYFAQGDHAKAIATFQQAVAKDPEDARAPEAQMDVGRSLMATERDDEALAAFLKIRELYPTHGELIAEAEYLAAQLYLDRGDLPGAAKHARRVVADYPTSSWAPRCQLMVGDILSQKAAWDRALEAYEKVVADYPDTQEAVTAQYRIAKIHFAQKDYKESLAASKKVLTVAKAARLLNTTLVREVRELIPKVMDLIRQGERESAD